MTLGQPPASGGAILRRELPELLLPLAIALGVASIALYGLAGYSRVVLVVWLAALVLLGVFFAGRTARLPRVMWQDLVAPGVIALALTPLYLVKPVRARQVMQTRPRAACCRVGSRDSGGKPIMIDWPALSAGWKRRTPGGASAR